MLLEVKSMNTVFYGVVEEEKERNLERQELYQKEVDALPKGSVRIKQVGDKKYYYRYFRCGSKMKSEYIGNDEDKAEEVKKLIAERKHLQGILKRLKLEYKQMCKVVKE